MTSYSDFVDRVFLAEELMTQLLPKDVSDRELRRRIKDASDEIIAGGKIGQPKGFGLIRGALLYLVDDLDGAHGFAQDDHSDLGSYWHGMMHRREGDFDNARYWFRRAGSLPFFDTLHHEASLFSADMSRQMSWDPYLFTGACEQFRFGADEELRTLLKLQRAEFDVIFDYSLSLIHI